MYIKNIIIFIVVVFVDARLKINITVASSKKDVIAKTSGTDIKLVTEKEIKVFNFTDFNINRGFRVELGKVPDNVFLKDPTPYEDLFEEFKWQPVKRVMYIDKVKILETVSEDVVLKVHRYTNNSTDTVRSNVSLFEDVQNVIYSSWSKRGLPVDNIYYDLVIYLNNNNFTYSNKWRDDQPRSRNLAVGLSKEGYIDIQPGRTITTKLMAYKTIVLVEIEYKAYLTGSVIGDYENLYGKYHFYAPSVIDIMKAAGLNNEVLTTELIEIRCYTSPRLDIVGKNGRKVFITRPLVPLRYKKKSHVEKNQVSLEK